MHYKSFFGLFYCDAFCEITRLVDRASEFECCIVGEKLARNNGEERVEYVHRFWYLYGRSLFISNSVHESFSCFNFVNSRSGFIVERVCWIEDYAWMFLIDECEWTMFEFACWIGFCVNV